MRTSRMTIHRASQRLGKKLLQNPAPLEKLPGQGKKHVTADGAMIHIRNEGWKEAQVGAVYEVDSKRRTEAIAYATSLGKRAELGHELYRLCGQPESNETKEMAFVSDAAKWLDEMQELNFPHATRIVDQWHAKEYIWDVTNQFYATGSKKAKQWGEAKVELLSLGKQNPLQRSLSHLRPRTAGQKEVLRNTKRYFRNHGHKMDYPRYEQMGFHIGSGVVEGACQHVIQSRFKRAGMRWSRNGAENLLALRGLHVNHQWQLLTDYQQN